ncbi:MAG: alpha/beta hydrolase [Roseiflexus sp.]|nr:alpha/beta hydrolase [Roseiflexus sp.]MCS7289185.1 alpha/beta hydrolase [Roseiflexus sp.]MDW8144772.1 alpha/beta hydrolase [Roseiflexaceae bacterium]MDW8232186.1 alpha/beta hydrolase [Roseiflexaceae bacterium]
MSMIVIDNQTVHYEVFGRGQPVLFLHGWMGSWRYWFPTIKQVAERYRAYSFDFWGFGESRRKKTPESIQNYSYQVIRFLDALGIDRVLLVGHSMGGMVALKTALDYPSRIAKVVTVGAPIAGSSLSWFLKLTYYQPIANTFAHTPWLRRFLFRHFLGETNDPAVHEILEDSLKSSAITLQRSIASMLHTDLRPELARLTVPALVVHGGRDEIVNPNQANLFQHVPLAQVVVMPKSRHFPFLDEPEQFNSLLLGFLAHDFVAHSHSPNRDASLASAVNARPLRP